MEEKLKIWNEYVENNIFETNGFTVHDVTIQAGELIELLKEKINEQRKVINNIRSR